MNFRLLLPLLLLLMFTQCKKFEDVTPRYDKEACVVCSHYAKEAGAGKCFNCKTTGVCSFCKGTGKRLVGKKDNYIEETCPFCNGSGKCHYCEGTGKCKTCDGTGKYIAKESDKLPAESK